MVKKKAWNSTNPLYRYLQSKKSKSRKVKSFSEVRTMAKRKSFRRSRGSISNSSLLMTVGSAMLYGAARNKLNSLTAQYLPAFAGQYTDEVVLGAAGWYLSKKGGIIGQIGKAALIIESASVGNQLAGNLFKPASQEVRSLPMQDWNN